MPARKKRASITLVGAGRLASVLGPALKRAGYRIDVVLSRPLQKSRRRATALARKLNAKVLVLQHSSPQSDTLWLCRSDDVLSETAAQLAQQPGWRGRIVFHSSGALASDVLAPLQRAGAHVASLHPMMTFAPGTPPTMKGVTFAVEGDRRAVAAARAITKALGAEIFAIKKESKVLYHALGSFSSPLLVAALATAERVGRAAGLSAKQSRKVTGPILHQTLTNYLKYGAATAYGGPTKRGDINTVRRHLEVLKQVPGAAEVYRALVRSALIDLPAINKRELLQLIAEKETGPPKLDNRKVMGFVPTRDSKKARVFYENVLGLHFVSEDAFALVFDANGTMLRVVTVKEFTPHPFTVLGWQVIGIEAVVAGLWAKGVRFEKYDWMEQDKLSIWTAPGGAKVAWFKDPDGNVLSVSEHG